MNAIPSEAWMEVDLRSSDSAALAALDAKFHQAVDRAVVEENARWSRPGVVTVVKELVGDRPAGSISEDAPIVRRRGGRARGRLSSGISEGSSDANLPMSLHIPAITIGGGGRVDERSRSERMVRQHRFLERDAERRAAHDCAGAVSSVVLQFCESDRDPWRAVRRVPLGDHDADEKKNVGQPDRRSTRSHRAGNQCAG